MKTAKSIPLTTRLRLLLGLSLVCLMAGGKVLAAPLSLATQPLFVEAQLPGNLVLVPSVEHPTVLSKANVGPYDQGKKYTGYFAANKCYKYHYDAVDVNEHHWYPVGPATDYQCSGEDQWSGNYLAWVGTQTIDTFRLALTGGNRVKDEVGETWLQKANHVYDPGWTWVTSAFNDGNTRLSNAGVVAGASPFSDDSLHAGINQQGHTMLFRRGQPVHDSDGETDTHSDQSCPAGTWLRNGYCYDNWQGNGYPEQEADEIDRIRFYNPDEPVNPDFTYRVYMRVKVCDESMGEESSCVSYEDSSSDGNWKPEGVVQSYSKQMRYSVFSYLNDHNRQRDGGVMRAPMKYVGAQKRQTDVVSGNGWEANANKEWDENTGVLIQNPDNQTTAMGVSIAHSGVINYINQFGELNKNYTKDKDPVSELYYAALRYLSGLDNPPSYSSYNNSDNREQWVDGFPVYQDWGADPIQWGCQNNALLGIGDTNSHSDKNLPGNTTYRNTEPNTSAPTHSGLNVITETNRVGSLEELGNNIGNTNEFSFGANSAYMAGLAYWANTRDIRTDLPGEQRAKTHWVDVMENQYLEDPSKNMYYLAAKYGGFNVSRDFDPENPDKALIEDRDWWVNGESLFTGDYAEENWTGTMKRPDNFYVAGNADAMVASLKEAFKSIANDMQSSSASVVANSTRLDTDSLVYQARFNTANWSGDLLAFELEEDGAVKEDPEWNAAEILDTMPLNERKVLVGGGDANSGFTLMPLAASHVGGDAALAAWVKGDRNQEVANGGSLRNRDSRLGDVINSNPAYSGHQSYGYQHLGDTIQAPAYNLFKVSNRNRQEIVLVASNDGMLHAFDADDGNELFAYIPSFVLDSLDDLVATNYTHQYILDGSVTVTDAWIEGAGENGEDAWRTLAVGTQGFGGRGLYVLDITDPANPSLLWEIDQDPNGYLGEGITEVSVIPVQIPAQGKDPASIEWRVVMGNGYNSNQEEARLLMFDLQDGALTDNLLVGVGNDGNGMAAVTAVNFNGSKPYADTIYGGDLHGDLWKFNQDNKGGWQTAVKLFDGDGLQPITSRPDLARVEVPADSDNWETMVYFGTGKFLESGDLSSTTPQYIYGLIDRNTALDQGDLLEQTILDEDIRETNQGIEQWRVTSNNPLDKEDGWFMKLVHKNNETGERVVVRPVIHATSVLFTTLIPSGDSCSGGGHSWLMALDKGTGGRPQGGVFDYDGDGDIDDDDYVYAANHGKVPISGVGFDKLLTRPNILHGPDGKDIAHTSDSSGEVTDLMLRGDPDNLGRQSWRQIR